MQRDRNDAHQPDRRGGSAVPTRIVIEIAPEEQARLLAKLRRARRNQWLTLHIVLLLALHRSPSEIAAFLLCARSTVYRAARDWQARRSRQNGRTGRALATVSPFFGPGQASGTAEENAFRLWLVPYTLELCRAGLATTGTTGHPGVGGNRAPLPARAGLGMETGQTRGQRQRPGACLETGPDSSCVRAIRPSRSSVVCR